MDPLTHTYKYYLKETKQTPVVFTLPVLYLTPNASSKLQDDNKWI